MLHHDAKSLALYLFTLSFLFLTRRTSHALSSKPSSFFRRIRSIIPQKLPLSLPWYEKGLDFSCTGCSKCCQVDGDVWVAPEEVTNIVQYLGDGGGVSSIDEFRKAYIRAEITPAGGDQQSESWMCLKRKEGACIFLDPSGQCGIYDVRPVQCSTYPFWPSLLEDPDAWIEESVLPDAIAIGEGTADRHWSAELGGCEGIGRMIDTAAAVNEEDLKDVDLKQLYQEQRDAVIIEREEIQAKRKAAKRHWRRFPGEEIKRDSWYL